LFCGLVVRPLCSGLAHLFACQTQTAYVVWWGVDYVSILLCVFGASLVFGRFTFYCLEQQQLFYYISVSGLFASTIISVLFIGSNAVRTGSFMLYVAFANGVPFIYQLTVKVAGTDLPRSYLLLWALMIATVGIGLFVKATAIPEVFWPGRFDYFFSSHQIWHILINSGNAMAYWVWTTYLDWRRDRPC